MTKIKDLLITFSLLVVVSAAAASNEPLPARFDGSMMPYDFSLTDSTFTVPDSLQPVYVCYVARHGARFLSSPKKVERLQKALYGKAMSKSLNNTGERFFSLLSEVIKKTGADWGALSDVGKAEQVRLAREMCGLFPGLMKSGEIEAEATYVPRVVMTMYEFCHTLARNSSDLRIYASDGKQYNGILRFFETDSAYRTYRADGEWKEAYADYVEKNVPYAPAERILGENSGYSKKELRTLTMDMYGIMQGLPAMGLPQPDTEFMSPAEYEACWKAANVEHYLRNTITSFSSSAGTAAGNLLNRIISDADEEFAGKEAQPLNASLFFGHAETLMPLFSLMGLPGCFALPLDLESLSDQWKDYEVVPLGANLVIGFYRSPSGSVYATARLNGHFVEPVKDCGRIVPWTMLRDHWLQRLDALSSR